MTTTPIDLVRDLKAALDGPLDLVTTSALLDLVSDSWLERLATEVAARGLPFYAALTYDGRVTFEPSDPLDAAIIAAVGNHQRRDKGFGPALGPDAAKRAIAMFEAVGYFVVNAAADWVMKPHDRDMLAALVDGWAGRRGRSGNNRCPKSQLGSRIAAMRCRTKNRQFASVTSMSSPTRLPGAERSDRNRTTPRHPVGGSSSVLATLLARARSAED